MQLLIMFNILRLVIFVHVNLYKIDETYYNKIDASGLEEQYD